VGNRVFVERIEHDLGDRASHRQIEATGEMSVLREAEALYGTIWSAQWPF